MGAVASSASPAATPGDLKALFGGIVRDLRLARRLTQRRLAEISGVKRAQISGYETGRVWPRAESLAPLLNALEVAVSEFFGLVHTATHRSDRVPPEAAAAIAETDEPPPAGGEITDPLRGGWSDDVLVFHVKGATVDATVTVPRSGIVPAPPRDRSGGRERP